MIGVYGVGDAPELNGPRAATPRTRPAETAAPRPTDGVEISREAATAARGILTNSATAPAPETIRAERIERAKENIAQGAYRLQEVVLQVAARIAPYVDS
jgi:anti-sigma28 factor (negative regulator of flagellin synthesis)